MLRGSVLFYFQNRLQVSGWIPQCQNPQYFEEKSRLETDVSALEEELETLAAASRTLTACTVLPLIVLIIAIVTAFLPLVSHLFGTRDF